jgi:ABC-type phosphate transport system substrate-binding protein
MKTLFLALLLTTSLYSYEYAIVVSKHIDIKNISSKQIKDIFMMKRHFVNNFKVVPVNLLASSDLRSKFETKVLNLNRERLNRYWIKKHFHGISPPVVQSSENSMKLFIKNVKGAIGYLPISLIDSDLKVLYEF